MRNNLFICWHLGLGDIIICNAIVREMAREHELVVIPVKHHNVPSVNYLFRDVPNVVIRGVVDDEEMLMFRDQVWEGKKTLNLGGMGDKFIGQAWDLSMYQQAGISFQLRWDSWKCERDLLAEQEVIKKSPLFFPTSKAGNVFVHADPARGIFIDPMRVPDGHWIEPHNYRHITPILFHWRGVIEQCDEIHAISSSFAHFIDSIDLPKNPKLFLHAYARPGEPLAVYRYAWEVLK